VDKEHRILTANLGIVEDGLLLKRLLDLARKSESVTSLDHRRRDTDLFSHREDEEMAVLYYRWVVEGKRGRKSISGQGFVYCLVTTGPRDSTGLLISWK